MKSKRKSIAVLGALVVLALAVSASAANATMLYEWKVGGASLKSGASKEITLKDKTTFVLTTGAPEVPPEIRASIVKLAPGAKVIGGKPGTFEGQLEFEGLSVPKDFHGCLIKGGKFVTKTLKAETVEDSELEKGRGATMLLFSKKSSEGVAWATIVIEQEKGLEKEQCGYVPFDTEILLHGTFLAEMSPLKAEAKVNDLRFGTEHTKSGSEYRTASGTFGHAEFGVNTHGLIMGGEFETELVSKEAFGVF